MGRKTALATGLALELMCATQALAQQQSVASDTAYGDNVKAALSAYRQGDYSPLLKLVQPRAAKGDAGARTILGLIYEDGKGVPKDDVKAANLFGQAALWGSANAETQLGTLYFQGRIGRMRNPVVGYALSDDGLRYMSDEQGRQAIHAKLDSESHSMTPDQVTQARVLADELQKLGLLAAMRDYLGDSAANQVLCQVPVGPNVCNESTPGSPPISFMVDANGVIHEDDKQLSLAELKDRFMVMAARAPQPEVIVTVESNGALASEIVQLLLTQARDAGIALVSVVPGNSLESVSQAGVHHLSFIPAEAAAGPDGKDVTVVPAFVVPRFRPDRQPVLVWLDEQGKVTAVRLDTRYPVAKPDGDAIQKAAQISYRPCLNGDAGTPCMMEVWVPASKPLQPDTSSSTKHELAIVPVSVLTRTSPAYPADAISALHEGTVTLLVHVSAKGLPMEINIFQTSGFRELDYSARNAVMNWTFAPQTIEGVVVDSYMKIPVNFGLNRSQVK